ncbi:hypothetical protein EDB84DRAFT_1482713, partial [Lactarius hengduanensis]
MPMPPPPLPAATVSQPPPSSARPPCCRVRGEHHDQCSLLLPPSACLCRRLLLFLAPPPAIFSPCPHHRRRVLGVVLTDHPRLSRLPLSARSAWVPPAPPPHTSSLPPLPPPSTSHDGDNASSTASLNMIATVTTLQTHGYDPKPVPECRPAIPHSLCMRFLFFFF